MSDNRRQNTQMTPPWAEAVEMSLLSCIFAQEYTVEIFQSGVGEEHFYDGRHKLIFLTQKKCWEANGNCQYPLVYTVLEADKETRDKYGGISYLNEIVDYCTSAVGWRGYVQEAEKYRKARKALKYSWEVRQSIEENVDVEKAVAQVGELTEEFQSHVMGEIDSGVVPAFDEFLVDLENYRRGVPANLGIPSGWKYLDKLLTGFHPGENVVIAGRPGTGKTVVGLNLAEEIAVKRHIPVLFISMEMRVKRLMERMACSMSRVNIHNFRTGYARDEDILKLAEMRPFLQKAPLHVVYRPGLKTFDFQNLVKYFVQKYGVKVVIIDYLALMKPSKPGRSAEEDISKVSDCITHVIRSNGICGITLAQMNRDSEKDKKRLPRLSDLRGSGSIEQDADSIIFLHSTAVEKLDEEQVEVEQQWNDKRKEVKMVVAKNRNGPDGAANFIFFKSCLRYEESHGQDVETAKVSFSQYLDDKWGVGVGTDVDISDIPF